MSTRVAPRQRILAAAVDLFHRKGFHATGIRELSEAAGLGLGSLYHHIGSKEELLYEISIELLQSARQEAVEATYGLTDPEQRLRALADHHVEQRAHKRDAWSVALNEADALTEDHRREVIAARDAYEELWAEVLADGARRGSWRNVDAVELRGILGMFNSTGRWLDPGGPLTPSEVAERYVELLLGGMRTRK